MRPHRNPFNLPSFNKAYIVLWPIRKISQTSSTVNRTSNSSSIFRSSFVFNDCKFGGVIYIYVRLTKNKMRWNVGAEQTFRSLLSLPLGLQRMSNPAAHEIHRGAQQGAFRKTSQGCSGYCKKHDATSFLFSILVSIPSSVACKLRNAQDC